MNRFILKLTFLQLLVKKLKLVSNILTVVDFRKYISVEPEKRFGKPVLTGTRISVYDVLNWLANGMTEQEIISDFPELNSEMIKACLAYAANRENRLKLIG